MRAELGFEELCSHIFSALLAGSWRVWPQSHRKWLKNHTLIWDAEKSCRPSWRLLWHFNSRGVVTNFTAGWNVWGKPKPTHFHHINAFSPGQEQCQAPKAPSWPLCVTPGVKTEGKLMGFLFSKGSSCFMWQWNQWQHCTAAPGYKTRFSTFSQYQM